MGGGRSSTSNCPTFHGLMVVVGRERHHPLQVWAVRHVCASTMPLVQGVRPARLLAWSQAGYNNVPQRVRVAEVRTLAIGYALNSAVASSLKCTNDYVSSKHSLGVLDAGRNENIAGSRCSVGADCTLGKSVSSAPLTLAPWQLAKLFKLQNKGEDQREWTAHIPCSWSALLRRNPH